MNVRTTMQHQVVSMRLSGDVWFLLSLFNEKKYFMVMDGRTDLPPPISCQSLALEKRYTQLGLLCSKELEHIEF